MTLTALILAQPDLGTVTDETIARRIRATGRPCSNSAVGMARRRRDIDWADAQTAGMTDAQADAWSAEQRRIPRSTDARPSTGRRPSPPVPPDQARRRIAAMLTEAELASGSPLHSLAARLRIGVGGLRAVWSGREMRTEAAFSSWESRAAKNLSEIRNHSACTSGADRASCVGGGNEPDAELQEPQ